MQEICSSNPPVVTRICGPNKSRARHHRSFKLGWKLKYLIIRSMIKPPLWECTKNENYKPVSWLVSINAYQWKSVYCLLECSHLKNFLKHIFEMGVNRIFDFRWVWKFCCDLSNVISGKNWLFRWDCVFFRRDFVLLCELWYVFTKEFRKIFKITYFAEC